MKISQALTDASSQRVRSLRSASRIALSALFMASGTYHFANSGFYVRMTPAYMPWPLALVQISGAAELVLGLALLIPRVARLAAWGLIALLVAVYPANIQMARHPETFPEFSVAMLWARLPLQFLLIAWAWGYARKYRPGPGHSAR